MPAFVLSGVLAPSIHPQNTSATGRAGLCRSAASGVKGSRPSSPLCRSGRQRKGSMSYTGANV